MNVTVGNCGASFTKWTEETRELYDQVLVPVKTTPISTQISTQIPTSPTIVPDTCAMESFNQTEVSCCGGNLKETHQWVKPNYDCISRIGPV